MLGRNVLADPKARTFGRSVLQVVLKFRAVVRNAQLRARRLPTFDRGAPVVLVRVPKSQALDLNGLRPVRRRRVVQDVLEVHSDPAMQPARMVGIVTRLARVRINPRDSNPAMQLVRVVDIVTRLVRELIVRETGREAVQE